LYKISYKSGCGGEWPLTVASDDGERIDSDERR